MEQQYMNMDMVIKKDNEQPQNAPEQPVAKPISQLDKLKLMIIRIGDEKRENVDEHLQKLKAQLVSPFVLKERGHKATVTDTLISCVQVMPHKVNLYSTLVALVAIEDFEFATEIVTAIVESLN